MNNTNLSRTPARRLSTPVRLGVAAVAACFFAAPALSNPVNPTVVNGTATFNQAGNVLTVTNSNGAIIHWDKFSIAAGEKTHFAQSSASSSVLNRVLSDPTAIYGTLSSNGRVWLINPAGIMVGAGGRVDTAAFVASTLNIRNEDFLAGRHLFINEGSAKDVLNQGEIKTPAGGSVYLIGSNVKNESVAGEPNSGIITTPGGETILAAGATVSLIDSALPGIKVDITGATGNATNLGEITAEAGRIGIAGVIVRNSGALNASSVVNEGGRIFLKASQDTYVDGNGRIVTTGTRGGSVEVLGNRVAVMDNASIDASGENGGGSIKVGGDYRGRNPDIQNASITYFGSNASLKADAQKVGAGGTVIVWADDTTRAYGSISARGGASGGNGGFVETSGHRYLDVTRAADVSAVSGLGGTWLLDPYKITIVNTGTNSNIPGADPFLSPGGADSTLTATTINSALATGNVSIITDAGGDMKFDASVSGPIVITNGTGAARVLLLTAGNDILFSGGSTTFQTTIANSPLTVSFNPANNRKVEVQSGATLAFNGFDATSAVSGMMVLPGPVTKTWENFGTINLSGESYFDLETAGYYAAFNNKAGGVLNITSSAGWSFLSESGTQDGALNNSGTINVNGTAGGSLNYTAWEARYNQSAGGVLNIGAGKVLSMQNADVIQGAVNIGAGGKLALSQDFTGAHSFVGTTITGPGWVDIAGGGVPSFSGVTVNNASLVNSAGDLTIPTGIVATTGDIGLLASGVMYGGAGMVSAGKLMLVGGWNTASSVTAPTVTSGVGSIQITGGQVLSAGDMTLKSGGDILIERNSAGSTRVESGGALAVETGGDLKLLNYYNPGGSVELKSAGNQNIQLTGAASNLVVEASGGGMGGGYTRISSGGTQTINFTGAGTHTLVLTGGMVGTTSASGAMASVESTGAQTILNGGALNISLTGGNVALNNLDSYEDYGLPSQRLICTSCTTHNSAQIRSKSSQTIAATTITIIGGSAGNGNWAGIEADGASTIVASGAVSITGGSSGGLYVGGTYDDYIANDAGISADGALSVTANAITLNGGSAAYGGAYIGGSSSVTVNTVGSLTLNGGTTAAQGAALTYADASPATMKWLAPAMIGSDAGSLANITINVGGDLTLNGGTVGQDGGSMALIGGIKGTPVNLSILAYGGVSLASANYLSDRIGSKVGGTVQISSGLGGTGGVMTLGKGLIGTGQGTGGSLGLHATSGGTVLQQVSGMIVTDWLNATATGAGQINLGSFENRVGNVNATTANQTIIFNAQSVGLGTINSGTGSSTISAHYDIHDNNGSSVTNITAGGVGLYSTYGSSPGYLAISADTATAGNVSASVSGSATNGGIYIRNLSGTPTSVILNDSASTNTEALFYNSGSFATAGSSFTAANSGDISVVSGGNLTFSGGTFTTGGSGSIGLGATGTLTISSSLNGGANDLLLAGSTVNIASPVNTTADILMAGGTINIGSSGGGFVTAQNVALVAGSLNIGYGTGGSGGITANNQLVAVITGDVNVFGDSYGPSYIKTLAGDLEMMIGGNLNISGYGGNAGYIHAGLGQSSPSYTPDASILVGGDIVLNNGAYIAAANDVYLDLMGSGSTLVLNDGTVGYAPSYILSDIGTGVVGTTHLAFIGRSTGGVIIDGIETTTTEVGGSGFFAVNSSTPAAAGAGLQITYSTAGQDLCAISPDLCKPPGTTDTPIDEPPPTFEIVGPGGTQPGGTPGQTAGGSEGSFGGEENGDDKTKDEKDKDKKSDQAKDEKKDDKPGQKKVAQCS